MTKKSPPPAKDLLAGVRPFQPMATRQIVLRPISSLQFNPRNARRHSKKQIRQIANSMQAVGFIGAVIIDEEGVALAGEGRLRAAALLGVDRVPTIEVTGLSEVQKRAFALADNKLCENGGWKSEILAQELGEPLSPSNTL